MGCWVGSAGATTLLTELGVGAEEFDPAATTAAAGRPNLAEIVAGFKRAACCAGVIMEADAERGIAPPTGTGTETEGGFAGSSNSGGGNIGWVDAFPVPDGPPPPTRFRGGIGIPPLVIPAAACCCCAASCSATICCWRAKTSRPLVTYPACISCLVKVSSAAPISCR